MEQLEKNSIKQNYLLSDTLLHTWLSARDELEADLARTLANQFRALADRLNPSIKEPEPAFTLEAEEQTALQDTFKDSSNDALISRFRDWPLFHFPDKNGYQIVWPQNRSLMSEGKVPTPFFYSVKSADLSQSVHIQILNTATNEKKTISRTVKKGGELMSACKFVEQKYHILIADSISSTDN